MIYKLKPSNPYYKWLSEEDKLQNAVIEFAELKHGAIGLPCNTESKKSSYEQYRFKALGGRKHTLDLFFPYPKKGYHGLFIELKNSNKDSYKGS